MSERAVRPGVLVSVAVAVSVIVGLGGCSGPIPGGDTPESAVAAFYRALGAKDSAAACALVAYDGKPLAGDDITLCRSGFDVVVTQIAGADELAGLAQASASAATVTGDNAIVRAEALTGVPAAYRQDVKLVRVAGRWYIESPE